MVHSMLLRDEKEYSPCPFDTVTQTRREKIGNPPWRKRKRLKTQGLLSMYFNNDDVAAAFPEKVKICALQRGSEAKELCTFPEKLIFNLQHLHLPQ